MFFRSEKVYPAISFIVLGSLCIGITAWTICQMVTFRIFFYAFLCENAKLSDTINYGAVGTASWVGVQNLTN